MPESLGQRLREFAHQLDRLPEPREPPLTTLQILGRSRREQAWQWFLFHFLSPDQPHGLGHDLLEHVLTAFADREDLGFTFSRFELDRVRVETEVLTSSGRRPDAIIWSPEEWFICWELKVGATEGSGQTADYVAAQSFGGIDLTKKEIAPDDRHYVYLAPEDASGPAADEFIPVSWEWIAGQLQEFLAASRGSYPARTTAQLGEFIDTIQSELTMTDYQESHREKAKLYAEYYDEIAEAREAFEKRWETFADEWATQLVDRMEPAEPVELAPLPDNKIAVDLGGGSERWILWQGNSDWAGMFRDGWWRHADDRSMIYRQDDDKNDVRITLFHRLKENRDRAARDGVLELQLWHGVGNGDKFMYAFKDTLAAKLETHTGDIPSSVTVTGKRGNVITATYDIPVAEYDDFFDAYLAAVEAAIQDLIVENETLIPLVTDAFEETFNDRQF